MNGRAAVSRFWSTKDEGQAFKDSDDLRHTRFFSSLALRLALSSSSFRDFSFVAPR